MPRWRPQLSRRHVQITLGVLWLLDGALQFQPFMYRQQFVTSVLAPNATGQPALIGRSITWAAGLVSHHLIVANTAFAVIQVLIGVGLLVRPAVRPAVVASLVWGLAVWWVGEGFGLLLTGHASPATGAPGAVLLYVVIAALAWPGARDGGPGDNGSPIKALPAKVTWALLWCGAGLLWLLPANRAAGSLHDAVAGAAAGQPAWLSGPLGAVAQAVDGHATMYALVLAALSAAVGTGIFTRRPVPYLVAGGVVSIALWVFGQGFGGVLTGQGTDPNAGPLFVVLALALLPRPATAASRPQRYSMAPGWSSG